MTTKIIPLSIYKAAYNGNITPFLDFMGEQSLDIDQCSSYGEPGYQADKGILFADWNYVPKSFQDLLEKQGYSLEWCDEWYVDHDYDEAWRTVPGSWHWVPSILIDPDAGRYITPRDSLEDREELFKITDHAQPIEEAAHTLLTIEELEELGYVKYIEVPSGYLYRDNLREALKEVFEKHNPESVIFRVKNQEFAVVWDCWYKPQPKGGIDGSR